MPLDGNGAYTPPTPAYPAIPGQVIVADDFNEIILDIAAALSAAIFRDGQADFTADQSLGGWKITNLANGVNPQDATTFLQVFTNPAFTTTGATGLQVTGTKVTISVTHADFSGSTTVTLPSGAVGVTQAPGDNSTKLATTAFAEAIRAALDTAKANIASPTFTGTPTAPTPTTGDNSTKIATTAFVQNTAMNAALPNQTGNAGKFLQTDGVNASWAVTQESSPVSVRTSNTILGTADRAKFIDVSSGTFSQTFDAAATLGDGWWCYIRNRGTGVVTLDPNGSETIDGATTLAMDTGESRLIVCTGTGFITTRTDRQDFSRWTAYTSTNTFTVPADVFAIRAYAFGAGGNGAAVAGSPAGGGGGGGCAYGTIPVTPGQSVTCTISAGVATVAIGATTYLTANNGANAAGATGGSGGTASKDAAVLNGGACSGGAGGTGSGGSGCGGGGASGSPIGTGGVGGGGGAFAAGAGGGWGGAGSTGGGGGGAGGAGSSAFGGGAGGAATNNVPGVGRDDPVTRFTDPLLQGLNGSGSSYFIFVNGANVGSGANATAGGGGALGFVGAVGGYASRAGNGGMGGGGGGINGALGGADGHQLRAGFGGFGGGGGSASSTSTGSTAIGGNGGYGGGGGGATNAGGGTITAGTGGGAAIVIYY